MPSLHDAREKLISETDGKMTPSSRCKFEWNYLFDYKAGANIVEHTILWIPGA
jgi:hypothetical protein